MARVILKCKECDSLYIITTSLRTYKLNSDKALTCVCYDFYYKYYWKPYLDVDKVVEDATVTSNLFTLVE
jgi:hypothetical protein